MTATELVAHLQAHGVTLTATDGGLRLHGPREVLTPAVIEQLRTRKAELLCDLLSERRGADHSRLMGYVRNVSQDPKVPRHPTEPCEKGHHDEWEFARSDPFGGDGLSDVRWYGYICRECRPTEQYGCWLPREAYRELQEEHAAAATNDLDGEDGEHV
jgi:hypothetical protein